ncbi:hypothetical protein [Kocuria sp.]|uniref:hypothetical protein n=1 Tax=Kocuria sp. TaxID=1871328 RepID=UPI0026DF7CDA|nr:hypothetical protein [Kocuria sp.]MDO5618219.1 hypothetical protein [Kocuria sp.]
MSIQSFDHLAAYLDRDDAGLTPDQRRRAAERVRRIKKFGLPQVAKFAARPDLPVRAYLAHAADLAELQQDRRLALTGVSHPMAEVYGPVVDAYLTQRDGHDLALFHLLEPSNRAEANVRFRIQDPVPRVRPLHVIADLLDDPNPRSYREAERLLGNLLGGLR